MVAWKCTWVENSLGCLVCTHISVLVSLRAQKVIMEIMGKGVCQTLSRAGFGLKISNQPEPSNYIKTRTVCRTNGWCKAKGMWAQQPAWSHCYTLFVSLCSDLLNKYISFKIVALHHRSALGHRDKCGMCSGLLEADKTSFVFFYPLLLKSSLVWYGWCGWLARQTDSRRGSVHVGDHTWARTDERFRYPACDNSGHRSPLWWQHPIVSTCPIRLTSWHSCSGESRQRLSCF